ncbi:T9SS type A sorting domain-containing protein [Fidelibacter multiformis]|uniref:T9SS type A sorting domain-containing protein n=1 Tax=Fidelibacter multiformis TaxID=3377529 RepID=UPI0037DCC755
MKKIVTILLFLIMVTSVSGQEYRLVWADYDFINGDDVTRSVAWNPVTDHLLVPTRFAYPRIVIMDPETGIVIGEMDSTGLGERGTAEEGIELIDVTADGKIYLCNLGWKESDWNFTVWEFENEDSRAKVVFDQLVNSQDPTGGYYDWYGASLDVIGTGTDKYLYTSGYQNNKMLVLKMDARGNFVIDRFIELPSINSARHGISAVTPEGPFWINGAGDSYPAPRLIDGEGNIIAEVPDSIISHGGTSTILHWGVGDYQFVTCANGFLNNTLRSARYFEDDLGTITFSYFGDDSDSLMLVYQGTSPVMNLNCSADIVYDSTRHWLYTVMGNNSLAAVDMDGFLKVRTPRDTGLLAIQIDGKMKEYCEYDHVGTSQNHDLYLTWGSNAVYFGITDHTLQDATLKNQLFLAFDLEPDGDGGSSVPPSDAGGVSALPFKADVVVHLEPWDNFDYTTGWVYTWNGSEWVVGSSIDGFDIGYGAMAWVGGETDTTLTEVAVAFNSAGLGEDFTKIRMMTYSAEAGSDGAILCAFPDVNPTETGAAFTAYYEADSLGSYMLPNNPDYLRVVNSAVSVNPAGKTMPGQFTLSQNYPNPFNPKTEIILTLGEKVHVDVSVFDLRGQLVKTLTHGILNQGKHTIQFEDKNLSSGVYLYRLNIDGKNVDTKKMVYIK